MSNGGKRLLSKESTFFGRILSEYNSGIEYENTVRGFFCLIETPEEIVELSKEDSIHFLAHELSHLLGYNLTEAEEGVFVDWGGNSLGNSGQCPIIVDLKEAVIGIMVIGSSTMTKKIVGKIKEISGIYVLQFNNDLLKKKAQQLDSITEFNYEFSMVGLATDEKILNSGLVKGGYCHQEYEYKTSHFPDSFCLKNLSGYPRVDSIAQLTLYANGEFSVKEYDQTSFITNYLTLKSLIRDKVGSWLNHHIIQWLPDEKHGNFAIHGQPLIFDLPINYPEITKLSQKILSSEKLLNILVLYVKSLQVDKYIVFADADSGKTVDVSLNHNLIRIKLNHPLGVPAALRLEYFIQQHLYADLQYYKLN